MSISVPDTSSFPAADSYSVLPLILRFPEGKRMTPDEYFDFCIANPDLRMEQLNTGEIVVMAPTGAESGDRNAEITTQLRNWAKKDGSGKTFDSSTQFRLPSGSARSPDASWVLLTRWNALSKKERKEFSPLCPDFVLELRSESDRLKALQEKMEEYLANGARLGWLVDPFQRTVHIYRPNMQPEVLSNPATVSGEAVLPGFVLEMRDIFTEE
jgi:Uma2 family endonuclease